MFLKTGDERQKHFACINLENFVYMEGVDETEEYPNGEKTAIYFGNGARVIPIPYLTMVALIDQNIKDRMRLNEEINEVRRKLAVEDQRKMMHEVLRDAHEH